jgi:hypothetical protein
MTNTNQTRIGDQKKILTVFDVANETVNEDGTITVNLESNEADILGIAVQFVNRKSYETWLGSKAHFLD